MSPAQTATAQLSCSVRSSFLQVNLDVLTHFIVLRFNRFLPLDKIEEFKEFHAHDLYKGEGPFEGIDETKRFNAIEVLLTAVRFARSTQSERRASATACESSTKQEAATVAAPKHTFAELQPLLDNRCFRTKTANEQKKSVQDIDALSNAEFRKTIDDLNSINAADRLLGTRGCETPK
jgi:hypothetical protein